MSNNRQSEPDSPRDASTAEERRELETVAAVLSNSSRLLRLLTYIGEKYFLGQTDKLHEYEIATEVFGRSRTTFNAGEDAIVRVEAHRLRKRLKEYYEGEGKDHSIQLTIPPGTYIPVFVRRFATPESPADPEPVSPDSGSPWWRPFPWWLYASVAITLLLTGIGIYMLRRGHTAEPNRPAPAASSTPSSVPTQPYAAVPLRILAGYFGKPRIDSAGQVWLPDQYFVGGGTWNRTEEAEGTVRRTSDPLLFEHWRNGDFSYEIPLRPGTYELHLYFVSAEPSASSPPTFSVTANEKPLLSAFDVNSDALGGNIADERVFRDIHPAANGFLNLAFSSERVPPSVNAIEILPGLPHSQRPIRIVMQPTSFTDHNGNFWQPDTYYLGGYTRQPRLPVTGTSDPGLYAGERYGNFSYAIPVDTRDQYTLILHFAELYFGPNAPGGGGVGDRIFRVMCNGNTLLDSFDIYSQAGSLHGLTETFYHLSPTAQGKLNITFEPIVNNATVSAIEVVDESH